MPLDFDAFRSMTANLDGGKLIYLQGDQLKSTGSASASKQTAFAAATDAFLRAYTRHYGAAIGDAARRFLEQDDNAGKPLSASVVRRLINFASDKALGGTTAKVGGLTIDLAKIGTDTIPFQGFRKNTKLQRAEAGANQSALDTLAAFQRGEGGKVDFTAMLRHLNTLHAHVFNSVQLGAVPQGTSLATADVRLLEAALCRAVDSMDNTQLSSVYQGLISRETADLKDEISRILNHPDADPSLKTLCKQTFTDLSRIEAMVVSEISRRMAYEHASPAEKQNFPSLMERYTGTASQTVHGQGTDMSATNLAILSKTAALDSITAQTAVPAIDQRIQTHGLPDVDAHAIGDMIRANDLTINVHLGALVGWRRDGSTDPHPPLSTPGAALRNTFASKEAQGKGLLSDGYLVQRDEVEKHFFPEYSSVPLSGHERPLYAAFNTKQTTGGGADSAMSSYGKVCIVLKQHVKEQATYTLDDTFFAARIDANPARRQELEDSLLALYAEQLKDGTADRLRGGRTAPDKPCIREALDDFYNSFGGQITSLQNAMSLSTLLSSFINENLKDGAPQVDQFTLQGQILSILGVNDQGATASFDNIENLLARQGDFTAVNMGVATMRRQTNPDTPCSFEGVTYIEAQLHGPVILDRDVAEIRIDVSEMTEHFEEAFDQLPQAERQRIQGDPALGANPYKRKLAWAAQQAAQFQAKLLQEHQDAPYKITFYDSAETYSPEASRLKASNQAIRQETIDRVKQELIDFGEDLLGKTDVFKASAFANVSQASLATLQANWGANLENVPDWVVRTLVDEGRKVISSIGRQKEVTLVDQTRVESAILDSAKLALKRLAAVMDAMDTAGIDDPAEREQILKQATTIQLKAERAPQFIQCHLATREALGHFDQLMADTIAALPNADVIAPLAFNGQPPVSGLAYANLRAAVEAKCRGFLDGLGKENFQAANYTRDALLATLRTQVVAPVLEPKMRLLSLHANWDFASNEDRNAFLGWATSAGKLKAPEELKGVYTTSGLIADAICAKLQSPAPLAAQDLIDAFLGFFPTCLNFMELEAPLHHGDYGTDDRNTAVVRATSVALSRIAARSTPEQLQKLADVLNTPEMRQLHTAATTCGAAMTDDVSQGSIPLFGHFLDTFFQRLPSKFGLPVAYPQDLDKVEFASVPPATRNLLQQINRGQIQHHATHSPYKPADNVAFPKIAAPAQPAAMPATLAQRKAFLKEMLPLYHAHEQGFDAGTNYHGRTHATRAFVLGTVMANILRNKGVSVDLNAVAVGLAGHDTGRTANGADTPQSEQASATNTAAAVERLYPGAAGDAWKNAVGANIAAGHGPNADSHRTIEGYLLKSADSLDYYRVGELDPKRFPFLRENLHTADGFIIPANKGLREKLMKEAIRLAQYTDPLAARRAAISDLTDKLLTAADQSAIQAQLTRLKDEARQAEIAQSNLTDDEIIALVEKAIADHPDEFPLLTQYYR